MKIAIQGHPTRGKEVIQILENLGGINDHLFTGLRKDFWYFIDSNWHISNEYQTVLIHAGFKTYTLEEFEKEFPFKIGDKVIWPVKVGWWSGIIVDLNPNYYKIIDDKCNYHFVEASKLKLYPMQKERNITLTLDKAKEWYKKGGELKEIALQAFTEEELTKVKLPKTWEEFCEKYKIEKEESYINSEGKILSFNTTSRRSWDHICPSKKSAEAHLAMIQLEQLRNCWWRGWKPIWGIYQKWCIRLFNGVPSVGITTNISEFLTFPTKEMAEEFLECFRDLIEKAGDLI